MPNKIKETKNNRKHDSQAESARAVFGKKTED